YIHIVLKTGISHGRAQGIIIFTSINLFIANNAKTTAVFVVILQLNPSTNINLALLHWVVWHLFSHLKQLSQVAYSAVNFSQFTLVVLVICILRTVAKTCSPRDNFCDFWAQFAVQIFQLIFKFFIAFSGQ